MISGAFLVAQLPGAGVGFVAGAFTPSVLRKIKALFVKETTAAKAAVQSELGKALSSVSSAAQSEAKKL